MSEILVIDDDQNVSEIVSVFLKRSGHQVLSASNGRLGLKQASEHHPELILLDLSMPEMDGCEVLRALKADAATRDIPVVIFTAHDRQDLPAEMIREHYAGYLMKPVNMNTLNAFVNVALHHPEVLH